MEQHKTFFFLLALLCYEMLGWAQLQNKRELFLQKKSPWNIFVSQGGKINDSILMPLLGKSWFCQCWHRFVTLLNTSVSGESLWSQENLFLPHFIVAAWCSWGLQCRGKWGCSGRRLEQKNLWKQKWLPWRFFWRLETATGIFKVEKIHIQKPGKAGRSSFSGEILNSTRYDLPWALSRLETAFPDPWHAPNWQFYCVLWINESSQII